MGMVTMLKKDDAVIHPSHGAGVVVENTQTRQVGGVDRQYHRIKLVSGRGTLFIPTDHVQQAGLLPVPDDADLIVSMLLDKPQGLPEDYQERKTDVTAKVHSGDIPLVAEALRDLAWRERKMKLSDGDARLKAEAQELLAGVLALQLDLDIDAATHQLNTTIHRAFQDSAG